MEEFELSENREMESAELPQITEETQAPEQSRATHRIT
jgi:hypothetical protein